MVLGDLVQCDRYHCRLSLEACKKRYRTSQVARTFADAYRGESDQHCNACRGCPQGKERTREG